ncbi:MAG: hypothetical protein H0X37_12925 [Herpetosiphonaceae bacterium]|nr:hypothetical protein [Herpetosiphonaceae bacterium]
MNNVYSSRETEVVVQLHQPLIAIPFEQNGEEVVHYFFDDAQADIALGQDGRQGAIKLAAVWSDLDGDAMLASLEQWRRESPPTPPLESL